MLLFNRLDLQVRFCLSTRSFQTGLTLFKNPVLIFQFYKFLAVLLQRSFKYYCTGAHILWIVENRVEIRTFLGAFYFDGVYIIQFHELLRMAGGMFILVGKFRIIVESDKVSY